MNWVTFSVVFMCASLLTIVGVDIFLLTRKQGATISEVLRNAARKWSPVVMLLCFGMGLLAGHWWWNTCREADIEAACKK